MLRRLALCLALLAPPAWGQEPNLAAAQDSGAPGSAARLVLAERAYDQALAAGEPLLLIAAIRLARGVTLRPATGWERTTEAPSDAATAPTATGPGSESALTIARNLAGEDPDLQDLVYDLDAQEPHGPNATAVFVASRVGAGETETWRLPLFGEVAAEIALLGEGAPLALSVSDEAGNLLCARPAGQAPVLCRLTPARNGFFILTVSNPGSAASGYRLIGN